MKPDIPANPLVVKWPSTEEARAHFEAYAMAVGKVAHAWNYLQEQLGQLFGVVLQIDLALALSVWYSTESDRTQRQMLRGAVLGKGPLFWNHRPNAKDDLLWLLDRADAMADKRNNAIHAPVTLNTDTNGTAIIPSVFASLYGHARAKRLVGKALLTEFEWYERYAETLSRFVIPATRSLSNEDIPWPEKPNLPSQGEKRPLKPPSKERYRRRG